MLNEDYKPKFSFSLGLVFAFHNTLLDKVRQLNLGTQGTESIGRKHGEQRYVREILTDKRRIFSSPRASQARQEGL